MTHPSRLFEEQLKAEVAERTKPSGTHLIGVGHELISAGRLGMKQLDVVQHWLETYEWVSEPDVCDHPNCIRPPHDDSDIDVLMRDEYQPPIEKPLRERLRGMSLADLYRRGRARGFFKPTTQYN